MCSVIEVEPKKCLQTVIQFSNVIYKLKFFVFLFHEQNQTF
jgi:hypothetical protein